MPLEKPAGDTENKRLFCAAAAAAYVTTRLISFSPDGDKYNPTFILYYSIASMFYRAIPI